MKLSFRFVAGLVAVFGVADGISGQAPPNPSAEARTCAALTTVDFSGIEDAPTQIIESKLVEQEGDLPAYCSVHGYVAPQIGFVEWMPISHWNGKILESGSGGAGGVLGPQVTSAMNYPLRKGYACIVSDTGHTGIGIDGLWAYGNLQTKVDWGYRSTHVVRLAGTAIAARFYGQAPRRAYFIGRSTGGRQALIEAERFPSDFDGIVAISPAVDEAATIASLVWNYRALIGKDGKPILSMDDCQRIHDAVVARFDGNDGVKDGLIGDPRKCSFDPADLLAGAPGGFLTPAQVDAVRKVWAGPVTSSGKPLYPGCARPVTDLRPVCLTAAPYARVAENYFRYVAFVPDAGPAWKLSDFDFDRDYGRMRMTSRLYDASDPDLRDFKAAGGRLIICQGWNDESPAPLKTVDFYETVERVMGGPAQTKDFCRLFMVPGMNHGGGGDGAFAIDYLSALEAWVERDQAPACLIGAHVAGDQRNAFNFPLDPAKVKFTRPIYPYPALARYKGEGDPADASNFQPDLPLEAASHGGDPRLSAIADLAVPGMTITKVEMISIGTFAPPQGQVVLSGLPSFCRVAAVLKPAPESNIRFEVWLPLENWNGCLLGTGNGGGAGAIVYDALAGGLMSGFATANTDVGTSPNARALIDSPERKVDFEYRATHGMTAAAKKIVQAFYGVRARRAYFVGGSSGGEQALMEAQRFPGDYDGIIAGSPGSNRTHLHAMFLWNWRAVSEEPGSALTLKQVALVTRAIVKSCAAEEGGAPGDDFLTDPRMCRFDPASLLPPAGHAAGDGFLTLAQVIALRKIYAGPTDPRTGECVFSPPPYGSERLIVGLAVVGENEAYSKTNDYVFRWAFGSRPDYYHTFDFDHDMDVMDGRMAPVLDATNPNLSGVRSRGAKLLMFAGTADGVVPFADSLNYYERVIRAQGGLAQTQEFFRYYVVPGLGHVRIGPGLTEFGQVPSAMLLAAARRHSIPQDGAHNLLVALMQWVELGVAPDRIIATAYEGADLKNPIRFQRPIYPYPKFPKYIGGDIKAPASFEAAVHERGGVRAAAERYLERSP